MTSLAGADYEDWNRQLLLPPLLWRDISAANPARKKNGRRRLRYPGDELGSDGVSLEACFFPEYSSGHLGHLRQLLDKCNLDQVYAWGAPGRSRRRRQSR